MGRRDSVVRCSCWSLWRHASIGSYRRANILRDLDEVWTSQEIGFLLTPEESSCLEDRLGVDSEEFWESSLAGDAEAPAVGDEGTFALAECLTDEHAVGGSVSMLNVATGGLSEENLSCVSDLLMDNPTTFITPSNDSGGIPATLRIMACLTSEEAAALTPAGAGPPPDSAGFGCLMVEFQRTDDDARIVAVLSCRVKTHQEKG